MLQKWAHFLFYTFVFFLPWQIRYIFLLDPLGQTSDFYRGGLYGFDVVFFCLCAVFVFWVHHEKKDWKQYFVATRWVWGIIIGLWVLNIFRFDSAAAYWIYRMCQASMMMVFFLAFKPSFRIIGWSFVTSVMLSGLLGAWQFTHQEVWGSKYIGIASQNAAVHGVSVVETASERFLRAYGGFSHPNILGGFLVFALSVLLSMNSHLKEKNILGMGMLLTALLVFSFSRSAFLTFFIVVGVAVVFFQGKQKIVPLTYLSVFLIMLGILSPITMVRLKSTERLEVQSTQVRISSLQDYKVVLSENFLIGVGPGNYVRRVQDRFGGNYPQPVHNIFLIILAEVGVLGVFLLGVLFFTSKKKYSLFSFLVKHLLLFIPFFIIGLFDHYWWTYPSAFFLLWTVALSTFLFPSKKAASSLTK